MCLTVSCVPRPSNQALSLSVLILAQFNELKIAKFWTCKQQYWQHMCVCGATYTQLGRATCVYVMPHIHNWGEPQASHLWSSLERRLAVRDKLVDADLRHIILKSELVPTAALAHQQCVCHWTGLQELVIQIVAIALTVKLVPIKSVYMYIQSTTSRYCCLKYKCNIKTISNKCSVRRPGYGLLAWLKWHKRIQKQSL